MTQSVLICAAHPDDEVLGCGGAIAKLADAGAQVHVAFFADGISSRERMPTQPQKELLFRRSAAQKSCDILGVSSVSFGDFPDNRLDTIALLDLTKSLENLIAQHSPELVFTHHAGDVNIDHRRLHEAVVTACRPQRGHPVKSILCFEVPSSTEWQLAGSAPIFAPNWFVDISDTLDRKLAALDAYADEMRAWPHPRSRKAMEHLVHWRGATVGVDAAEAFMLGAATGMKVIFRVDASNRIGLGHFMRCLTLAESLVARNAQVHFICREHEGNQIALLEKKGIFYDSLPISDASFPEGYESWLGVSQDKDASQTIKAIQALGRAKPDWLIVDHYELNSDWERRLRSYVGRIFVIDDLANRTHDCDILLDQNYQSAGTLRYRGLVPDNCKLMIGPRYALIRPEYTANRKVRIVRDEKVKRILVFFGGTDPHNMTGLVLEALTCEEFRHLDVDIVIGVNYRQRSALQEQINNRLNTTLYSALPNLADLMIKADLAFGAGGTTTWERMSIGLSSLVITIADNQIPTADLLNQDNFIRLIGNSEDVHVDKIREVLRDEIENCRYKYRSEIGMKLCDGMGVARVANEIL